MLIRIIRWAATAALGGFLTAGTVHAQDAEPESLAAAARAVLKEHCWRCHNGQGSAGGNFDVLDAGQLTGEFGLVEAGAPDESYLIERVVRGEMPPAEIPERLTAPEAETLRRWVAAGAPVFPAVEGRPFVAQADLLEWIAEDLRGLPQDDRPFQRYFTFAVLHNDPRLGPEDLRAARAALSKALNSLTWEPTITPPRPVGGEQLVLAIDLRQYGWTPRQWSLVLEQYPYGLEAGDSGNDRLLQWEQEIDQLARPRGRFGQPELLHVRADWFVATATRPPLYHDLLGLPETARELERTLRVDVVRNLRPVLAVGSNAAVTADQVARGGFARSGVSGQNRLVERHRAPHGAYWQSYDFKADSGRAKLTRFPLGPENLFAADGATLRFPEQAFVHDGGEIIFHLPNGLQGYLLVDGQGQRIDAGPIEVVSDALKTSGTPLVVNGLSCMACHKHGTIPFADEIRAGHALFGDGRTAVEQLYPEQPAWDRLLAQDRRTFLAALRPAVDPFLDEGERADFEAQPEPVGRLARQYRFVYLDLAAVARELDLADPSELASRVGQRRLKELGLEALLQERGVISRPAWEARNRGVSLFQELARELGHIPRNFH